MILCVVVAVFGVIVVFGTEIAAKKGRLRELRFREKENVQIEMYRKIKNAAVLVIVFAVIGLCAGYAEESEMLLSEEGYLIRQESGSKDYEAELLLEAEGMKETTFSVVVPKQYLTTEEESVYLEAALSEMEAEFIGENSSVDEIRKAVCIQTDYQDGIVTAEWEFDNPKLVTEDGTIVEEELSEDGEVVKATLFLTCEDSSLTHEFYFTVYQERKSKEELLYDKIYEIISENGKAEGTEKLFLPTDVDGYTLIWKNKRSDLPVQILLIGVIIILLLPNVQKEREKEVMQKKEAQLLWEYPEMVNKLTLLLGAGMTLQAAWNRITTMYSDARKANLIPRCEVYEEMLITRYEIENGKGEIKSYEAFGERCRHQKYRKLSSYLIQNLKLGSSEICTVLEKEASEVFAERKNMAQRYGEEAGTKLLLPMMLMLGIVIFIIMVPAVISFQVSA